MKKFIFSFVLVLVLASCGQTQQAPVILSAASVTTDTTKVKPATLDTVTVFTGPRGGHYKWRISKKTGVPYKKYIKAI